MSSREREKCLDVLGLPHSSSEDDIKKAYRRLAKQYHPDKNTGDGAKEQFQEISYAYKYLIEGPAAVGIEDDEDEGIPIEVLIRLFPWMFGGPRFHPFYHDPFDYYPGMYEESSDEDDYDYYSPHVNGFNFKPSSTYTPGPSKEEKKKEKKKKAKERRKAAKMTKAPGGEYRQTNDTSSSEKVVKEDKTQQENNNNSNVTETKGKGDNEKDKTSENQNISGPSSTPTGPDTPQTPSKKSKKKLKQEQKKREREMELIANEFKQKQKEQAEKEAKKEEMRKEKEKMEEIRREETRKKELEEITRREEKRKEELLRREKEKKESGRSARAESADDSISPKGGNSESTRTVSMSESEGGRIENVDDVSDVDDGSANDSYHDDKWRASATHQGYSAAQGFGGDSNGSYNSTPCVRPKVTHASRSEVDHQRQRSRCKTQYKDTRSSSRGSERSSASSQPDRQTYMSKKIKRNGRKKQVEADDWSGEESVAPFDSLMPQSEAEEMRMFHEAIIMSQRDAKQQGVIPETEEEERRMLEAALRESQRTAQRGGLDTLDDVSDFEDGVQYGADSASCAGAGLGDWHQSIGQNSSRHNKENVAPNFGLADTSFKLGGLGATSSSYRASGAQAMGTGSNGSTGQSEKFDKAVGGKVKGKNKSKTKKNTSDSWEFGGGAKPVHTANVEGLQFGLVDFGCVSDEDESHIPAWAREDTAPYNQYSNQPSHEDLYDERYGGSSKHNPQPQPGVHQNSSNSYRNQAGQTSGLSSSKCSPATAHVTTAGLGSSLGDMDDIDDVDTFEDSNVPSFGSSAEPTSSFDLNIPAAFSNKKIKTYYQKKT